MCIGVSQLILLVSFLDRDEDAQVVLAGAYPNASASKFGTDLVEASGGNTPFGTVNVEG
jgi:hypothetical protein